jgi:hypothetical protein
MKFDRSKFIAKISPIIETKGIGVLHDQTRALDLLLGYIEGDSRFDAMNPLTRLEIIAYFLASVAHETTILTKVGNKKFYVKSFKPVEEMGSTSYLNRMYDTRTDLGNTRAHDGDGARYAGDGYVQNTGRTNAERTGRRFAGVEISYSDIPSDTPEVLAAFTREGGSQRTPIRVSGATFVREHELLRVPKISYLDAMDGILTGRYTGRKADDYFRLDSQPDYYHARRIINAITAKNEHVARDIERMSKLFFAALNETEIREEEAVAIPVPNQDAPPAIEAEAIADLPPTDLGAVSQQPATSPQTNSGETAPNATIQTLIPHMDTAKGWIKSTFGGASIATALAWYTNMPPEIRYGLMGLLALIVSGATFVFIKYHSLVFQLVTEAMKINADPNLPSVDLVAHQK